MKAIFMKEWKGYFQSPIGYIFTGVFLIICSMFFISGALMYQQADLGTIFSNINIIYLFLVSILTMGLLSLERSRRTDQLLFTAPVSVWQVVIGKYLAAMATFGITLLISLIFPVILSIYGHPSMSEMIGSYLGFILLWGAFIAIGLFLSSLTESQMIAAVVTFGALLLVFYMDWFTANITNPVLFEVVEWFSLMSRYTDFQNGILDLVNVVYYLSFIAVFLFLTVQVIRYRQNSEKKFRINHLLVTVSVLVGVILVNSIVGTIGEKLPMQLDLTQDRVYEFSDQTKEVMKALDSDVEVLALYPKEDDGEFVEAVREYLAKYQQLSDHFKVEYIDPYTDPSAIRPYGDNVSLGSVIVKKGDKFRVIPLHQIYQQSQSTGTVFIDMERQVTSAVRDVVGGEGVTKAYMTQGHNEYSGGELKAALESEGFEIETINLATTPVPEDATVLISMAPSVDFTAEERDALDEYLMRGGKAAFVFSARNPKMERLNSYLQEWGITIRSDYAMEGDSSKAFRGGNGVSAPAPALGEHSITEKIIESGIAFIAPGSCSFGLQENNVQHTFVTSLLQTSQNSWGIMDLSRGTTEKAEGDIDGPLDLAAIAEKSDGNQGMIFVMGSLQAVETNGLLNNASYCNGDLMMNAFSYLADKGDVLEIRAKVISPEKLTMTETQVKGWSTVLQYFIPGLILLIGLVVWLRRRYL